MDAVQALVLVLVFLCPAISIEVQVLPDLASDCSRLANNHSGDAAININTAIANVSSNTTLRLQNGCYLVKNFTLLQDLSDISLIGSGSETTIVKCQSDGEVGLAFVNISGLVLSDLTITGCGLSANGVNLWQAFNAVNQSLNLFYSIIAGTTVGIFIGDTSDLQLHNIIVQKTSGIGMVTINLMGTSDMSNVTFRENVPLVCQASLYNITQPSVGGGLFVLYADYLNHIPVVTPKLTISSSWFVSNSQCNPLVTSLRFTDENTIHNNGIGLGGGLGLALSQVKYSVNISIVSTTFENNTSPFGGGASVICHEGVNNSYVNISDSIFRQNGISIHRLSIQDYFQNGLFSTGGGLGMTLALRFPRHNQLIEDLIPSQIQPNTVVVENTTIEDNKAIAYAGMTITSYNSRLSTETNQNNVIVKSSRFLNNRSPISAAFGAQSLEFSGSTSEVNVVFENVIIWGNDVSSFTANEKSRVGATGKTAVASLSSINVIIRGKTKFFHNFGSALLLLRSIVTIDGDVNFIQNDGSGMILF